MFLALEPAGDGPARRGHEIPVERTTSPYDVVEAFTGLAETSARDRHRPAGRVADHAGRPDPQHARGVPGGARRASPRCRRTSPPATSRSTPCSQNLEQGLDGPRRARRGHHRADARRRRPLPGAGRSAARPIHDLLVSTSTLSQELTALVRQSRADLKPALTTSRRRAACSTRTRTTSTTACG